VLGPQHIGAIAATGVDTVFTARRPRVAIISTGDELIAPGTPPEYGQIPDSNAPLIAATLRQLGAEPTHQLRIRDSADRKSTRLNSSHVSISYAVFCLKKKKKTVLILIR